MVARSEPREQDSILACVDGASIAATDSLLKDGDGSIVLWVVDDEAVDGGLNAVERGRTVDPRG